MSFKTLFKLICLGGIFCFASAIHAQDVSALTANQLLNQYYTQAKNHPAAAEIALKQALVRDPNNVILLKEMGYLLLQQNNPQQAVVYFQKAHQLAPHDDELTLQTAYTLNVLNRNREAYNTFKQSAGSTNPDIRDKSRQAMMTLAGQQTHFLPDPYFAEFYFAPYYLSHIADTIFPTDLRIGMKYGPEQRGKVYLLAYSGYDTASNGGQSPIIYSDNSLMLGAGTRYQLFAPLSAYFEIGRAYYYLYQANNGRWKNDLRGGLTLATDWGKKRVYSGTWESPLTQMGEIYGNAAYYSRYGSDWIAQLRLREGLRVLRYHYSSVDVYLEGQVLADTRRYYYNNFGEIGAGFAFTPDNRWNVTIRTTFSHGIYFPTSDPTPNPYGANYNQVLIALETFFGF